MFTGNALQFPQNSLRLTAQALIISDELKNHCLTASGEADSLVDMRPMQPLGSKFVFGYGVLSLSTP